MEKKYRDHPFSSFVGIKTSQSHKSFKLKPTTDAIAVNVAEVAAAAPAAAATAVVVNAEDIAAALLAAFDAAFTAIDNIT